MRRSFLFAAALLLASCASSDVPDAVDPASVSAPPPAAAPLPETLSQPPVAWTLTGAHSLYTRLYREAEGTAELQRFYTEGILETPAPNLPPEDRVLHHRIMDRIVTAVAADLVTQFYATGTEPLYGSREDLVVWQTDGLVPLPPEELTLKDEKGAALPFQEVQLFVRDALFLSPMETCGNWKAWWQQSEIPIIVPEEDEPLAFCIFMVNQVRDAVQRERALRSLRLDLLFIAYGEEMLWDGQLEAGDTELRSYDLLVDVAGAGSLLGSAQYQLIFSEANQGEQCDSELCPACILPAAELCGDGAVQGAEQCDDGNRYEGDGCDSFCQVEQHYCGNGTTEPWEVCDDEGTSLSGISSGRECPDGLPCADYGDCTIGGNTCSSDPSFCGGVWQKTCKYSGTSCRSDADCLSSCPYGISSTCREWVKDACRFSVDGVCAVGEVLEGTLCTAQGDCSGISSCQGGYCTSPSGLNVYLRCGTNFDCFTCRNEEILGTCYATGERCNSNEDCPQSGYCVLEPEGICRTRTRGGRSGPERSTCNAYCEDVPHCGDRVVYMDGTSIEECDDGMQCDNGQQCAKGQRCEDGSTCRSRDGGIGSSLSCTAACKQQQCGDGELDPPEQCDTGARCIDGSSCDIRNDESCAGKTSCGDTSIPGAFTTGCTLGTFCSNGNLCILNASCHPRSNDGDNCSEQCLNEYCGDAMTQKGEECDNGGTCANGAACSGPADCPSYRYCERFPARQCVADADCPAGSRCFAANPASDQRCHPKSGDGCDSSCQWEPRCGDGAVDPGEECDDGNLEPQDGCDTNCRIDIVAICGNGTVEPGEECEPDQIVSECVGGPNDGDDCSNAQCLAPGRCYTGPDNECNPVTCTLPQQGNCSVEGREECDDGTVGAPGGNDSCDSGTLLYCGDGAVNLNSEECDPPNASITYSCCGDGAACPCAEGKGPCVPDAGQCTGGCRLTVNTCPQPSSFDTCSGACGDGCLDMGIEQCDDGNTQDGDGCNGSCQVEYCGDAIVNNNNEECDLGSECYNGPNIGSTCSGSGSCGSSGSTFFTCGVVRDDPSCSSACLTIECGDCRIDAPNEECEDGAAVPNDGCSDTCRAEYCGDGVTQFGPDPGDLKEECDDGGLCHDLSFCAMRAPDVCVGPPNTGPCFQFGCDSCNNACSVVVCGDGVKECVEECDDGNTTAGDGCDSTCRFEFCGDGVLQPNLGEQCDTGAANSDVHPDACRTDCKNPACGDGVVDANEECDVPTCPNGAFCTRDSDCSIERCLPRDGGGHCSSRCTIEGCGDALLQPQYGEQCDDGNTESGDGCSRSCHRELSLCGNGVLDSGEECDFQAAGEGMCPDGSVCDVFTDDRCDLGTCDQETHTCTTGNYVCMTDQDCNTPCEKTCTTSCRTKVFACGDGYRAADEQCDDGNREDGDGCSFYCTVERLDLCGNGVVDFHVGEECDQGHPYATLECTPYCRKPLPAPMCGDGRKDPSGSARGDVLEALLTMQNGYRLGGRFPDGKQIIYPGTMFNEIEGSAPALPAFRDTRSAGGWYVAPRAFNRREETPVQEVTASFMGQERGSNVLEQRTCSQCGNGRIEEGEQCDSGRLSGGSYPEQRVNQPGWARTVWAEHFMKFGTRYYWHWYWNVYPYHPSLTYGEIREYWHHRFWDIDSYISFIRGLGGRYWYFADAAWRIIRTKEKVAEGREFVTSLCNARCRLALCGDDRIQDGETCEDTNMRWYSTPQNGDGCSSECFLERGFDFSVAVCGDDVVSGKEECDDGGVCEYTLSNNAKVRDGYCRFDSLNPGRNFCVGEDQIEGTADDGVCRIFGGDGCDENCDIEPTNVCGNGKLEPYEMCDPGGRCTGGNREQRCASDGQCMEKSLGTCVPTAGDGCAIDCLSLLPPVCGNGIAEPWNGEECDPGSTCPTPTTCSVTTDSIYCSSSCLRISSGTCGDGKWQNPELCDRGAQNSDTEPNACRTNCFSAYCGDGVVDRHEECDDGNQTPHDNCTNCLIDLCGNGRLDVGETCEPGLPQCANGLPCGGDNDCTGIGDGLCIVRPCSEWCTRKDVCGNHELDPGEQCDDGNSWSGDGCSGIDAFTNTGSPKFCQLEYCGDGIAQEGIGEQCDDGAANSYSPDACRPDCQLPVCGDTTPAGIPIVDAYEACDPGRHCAHNPSIACSDDFECPIGPCDQASRRCVGDPSVECTTDFQCMGSCEVLETPTCNANCTEQPFCGDEEVHGDEECDPPGAGCTACRLDRPDLCGNGRVEGGEQCDDGNQSRLDGCSETCQLESFQCPGICFLPYECSSSSSDAGEVCDPSDEHECEGGVCTMRTECALLCTFGSCGNGKRDPGEQCDDGRHCLNDPKTACNTHLDCGDGSCSGADPASGTAGTCSGNPARACMTSDDCRSLCLAMSGDGCSSECLGEPSTGRGSAELLLCQEEVSGGYGRRIGSGEVVTWQRTLLDTFRNPFNKVTELGARRHLGTRGVAWWEAEVPWWDREELLRYSWSRIPWYFGSGWWPELWYSGWWDNWNGWYGFWGRAHVVCGNKSFPNSIGNLVQASAGCFDRLSQVKTMPERTGILPLQPAGLASFPACQEPRAQIVSAVEIPNVPTIAVPPYRPSELVRDLERYICSQSGQPRRGFSFLCANVEHIIAPPPLTGPVIHFLSSTTQQQEVSRAQELLLAHALDVGYRAGESFLSEYLEDAFTALRSSIETALTLLSELQRIRLTETACPLDSTALCSP